MGGCDFKKKTASSLLPFQRDRSFSSKLSQETELNFKYKKPQHTESGAVIDFFLF